MPTKARRQKEANRRAIEELFSNIPEYATRHADRINADLQTLLDTLREDEKERLKSYQRENNAAQKARALSRLHDFAARYRDLITKERLKSYQRENNAAQKARALSRLHDFAARYRDLITKDKSARWVAIRIKDASDSKRSVEAIARDVRTVRKVLFTEKK